ncbi:MAG: FKBP-type peptidyl-prolyl cis-trans isomerase [Alphaproteobacteria bacterium]|nr:FKBP-type peptidyl-prolyl cis-trans isomerase [Alphaproteobacteria bacterium]
MLLTLLLACAKPAPPPPPRPTPEVQITVTQEGHGDARIQDGSLVSMHYELKVDGAVVDSSYARGAPLSFTMGNREVIRGWEIGVDGMQVGERRTLVVPPELGYGAQGAGSIPPNATLHFNIELIDTKDPRFPPASPHFFSGDALTRDPSGLSWADIKPCGEGATPTPGAELLVDYSVFMPDGTLLESTLSNYDPARLEYGTGALPFSVELGLEGMSEGCSRQLRIPPELGGGQLGQTPLPRTQVVFVELELVDVR